MYSVADANQSPTSEIEDSKVRLVNSLWAALAALRDDGLGEAAQQYKINGQYQDENC